MFQQSLRTYCLLLASLAILSIASTSCSNSQGSDSSGRPGGRNGSGSLTAGMGGNDVEAVSVKAFKAARKSISTYILANTSIESIRKVAVYAKVNALVQKLMVEEGSFVRSGQVMARLDDGEIRNEFVQAQIALEQAESSLKQADVRAELSKANFERALSLLQQKLISQQEYDQAALSSRTDSLAFEGAGHQRSAAIARLEAAQIQLDYTEIRSSINGVVTQRLIEVGTRVNVNQEVFVIEEYPPLWARIYVPEKELPQLRLGQLANLRVQAFADKVFDATVHMISPTVDPESGTVKVTLQVRNPGTALRPGMFGTVYIATETHSDAIVIPKRAILRERDEDRVFVVNSDSRVEKRVAQLGFSQENEVEVLSGVSEGEIVVTVGQEGLNDDYPVSILAWDGEPGQLPVAGDTVSPEAGTGAVAQAGRAQGQWGGPGAGQPDPERLKMFLDRMLANPEVKAAYEAKLKENPGLADNPEELRSFLREMRQKTGRGGQ